jgi:2-methylisocitrate lyase-like PEP mutase family enzyme
MTATRSDKAMRFRALHQGPHAFVIPDPWDAGSARVLTALGFQALATSSGAQAGVLGRRDGQVARDEALAHARAIVGATDLPVSADWTGASAMPVVPSASPGSRAARARPTAGSRP